MGENLPQLEPLALGDGRRRPPLRALQCNSALNMVAETGVAIAGHAIPCTALSNETSVGFRGDGLLTAEA